MIMNRYLPPTRISWRNNLPLLSQWGTIPDWTPDSRTKRPLQARAVVILWRRVLELDSVFLTCINVEYSLLPLISIKFLIVRLKHGSTNDDSRKLSPLSAGLLDSSAVRFRHRKGDSRHEQPVRFALTDRVRAQPPGFTNFERYHLQRWRKQYSQHQQVLGRLR
jgi:hypothetical protein